MYDYPEPILLGGPLLDAANPEDNVPTAVCAVCGTASDLTRINLSGPAAIVCMRHLEAALRGIGPATVSDFNVCSGQHTGPDPMQTKYGVVAHWPPHSSSSLRQANIRACPTHLADAITALAAARGTREA